MTDNRPYLLDTASKKAAFVVKYGGHIEKFRRPYISWISELPMMEWINPLQGSSASNPEFVIGLVCLLYIEGEINISFSDPAAELLRREPASLDEWHAWCAELRTRNTVFHSKISMKIVCR